MKSLKRSVLLLTVSLTALLAAGCVSDADVASRNLAKAAEQFEIKRRVVFVNVMADTYILSIEGLCSIEDKGHKVAITCKTGPGEYKKHQMGRTETVTYFSEQLTAKNVSAYHYRVIFKPQSIIPDIDLRGDADAAIKAITPDSND